MSVTEQGLLWEEGKASKQDFNLVSEGSCFGCCPFVKSLLLMMTLVGCSPRTGCAGQKMNSVCSGLFEMLQCSLLWSWQISHSIQIILCISGMFPLFQSL